MNPKFDLNAVPFTAYGSSLTLIQMKNRCFGFELDKPVEDGVYVHALYDDERYRLLFKVSFCGGSEDMEITFRPETLRLSQGEALMDVCFPDNRTMRFCGKCGGFSFFMAPKALVKYNAAQFIDETKVEFNIYTKKAILYALKGSISLDAPWDSENERNEYILITVHPDESGEVDFVWEEFKNGWPGKTFSEPFEKGVARRKAEFEDFCARFPRKFPGEYQDSLELAQYILWSGVVYDNNHMKRKGIYASKNWMNAAWSWDNLFAMQALMEPHPDLAWDQFLLFVDDQDETGGYADWICSYRINNAFIKPPVQGIIFGELMERLELDAKNLATTYDSLCKNIDFFFQYRDYDGDGIPEYCHGNDSGADNATVFDESPHVEGADLGAYLVIQMECLGKMASKLGKADEAKAWEERSKAFLAKFISHSYDEERGAFISPRAGTHTVAAGDCLMNYIPIILGRRLPQAVLESLIAGLKEEGRFSVGRGFATESVSSPKYASDSYWRGPVWAPWTYFIIEAFDELGERAFAKSLAFDYMDMLVKSGFYESHDALSGHGLRDGAYVWTAAVFITLGQKYLQ